MVCFAPGNQKLCKLKKLMTNTGIRTVDFRGKHERSPGDEKCLTPMQLHTSEDGALEKTVIILLFV